MRHLVLVGLVACFAHEARAIDGLRLREPTFHNRRYDDAPRLAEGTSGWLYGAAAVGGAMLATAAVYPVGYVFALLGNIVMGPIVGAYLGFIALVGLPVVAACGAAFGILDLDPATEPQFRKPFSITAGIQVVLIVAAFFAGARLLELDATLYGPLFGIWQIRSAALKFLIPVLITGGSGGALMVAMSERRITRPVRERSRRSRDEDEDPFEHSSSVFELRF